MYLLLKLQTAFWRSSDLDLHSLSATCSSTELQGTRRLNELVSNLSVGFSFPKHAVKGQSRFAVCIDTLRSCKKISSLDKTNVSIT